MQTRRAATRRRLRRRRQDEAETPAEAATLDTPAAERLGGHYATGPLVSLGPDAQSGPEEQARAEGADAAHAASAEGATAEVDPAAELSPVHTSGQGEPAHDVAFNTSLRLEGRTDATFDGGSFHTERVRVTAATGCPGCSTDDPCIRARGTLVATYAVTTTVTLPSADDFPNLRPCQRQRVQNAIDTVLAPHEQQHVTAFNTYNGTTRTAFDLTLCRSEFDAAIQTMHDTAAAARQSAAQAASDALDPFHFDVDINCEDPPAQPRSAGPAVSGVAEEPETVV